MTQALQKILILEDDDLDFQVLVRHMSSFREAKYELLRAKSTLEARALIAEHEFVAALVDYSLSGGESGLDFVNELGGREAAFPMIILTGMEFSRIDEEAILMGAHDYIEKIAVTRDLIYRSIRFAVSAREYENRLRESVKEAEAQATINRDILSVVGHEMQSPISSMIGYCDCIVERSQTDATCDAAEKMRIAARHLEDFLQNLSEFVRLDCGVAEVCQNEFSPGELLEETIQLFAPYAVHKGIELKSDFSSLMSPVLIGDCVRIRQVLINLIKNAVKYSDDGTISVSAELQNGHLIVEVTDDGVGMTEAQVSAILNNTEKWQRPGKELKSGLGLGLSICSRLLTLMNGKLTLHSRPGEGTTAGFYIPLSEAVTAAA